MKIYTNISGQFPGLDLSPMTVNGHFWRAGEDKQSLPDRDYFIERCQGDGPLCINIEHWKWDIRSNPYTVVDESISKLMTLTRWATDAFPGRVVGHYSLFPLRDYWTPQYSQLTRPLSWHKWRRANGYLKRSRTKTGEYHVVGLADLSHVTMPSLYTFYEDVKGWVKYAKANIKEARKFGKPVVPFLWPRYHDSNAALKYTGIPGDYWRLQLDTLAEAGCDEAVIWDAAQYFANIGGEVWNQDTPWIAATKDWMVP